MEVVVYSKPNCQQCEMTKSFLTRKGVEYLTIDISEDMEAYSKVAELGYRQVPVVQVGEDHWYGFQPAKLSALSN